MSDHGSRITDYGFFVTGTDTGVGKTLVACALLHAHAARGMRVIGMKPVAAGGRYEGGRFMNEDVAALMAAGNVTAPHDLVNPYCFEPAIAPHIAAQQSRVGIDIERVSDAYAALARLADCVIVEGAGGFRVPLSADHDTADLAAKIDLPVILVVGMRLGCLNHALLTAQAVRSAGLPLAGWVANHIDPAMPCANENVSALDERLGAPLIARIAYARHHDAALIAKQMEIERLRQPVTEFKGFPSPV